MRTKNLKFYSLASFLVCSLCLFHGPQATQGQVTMWNQDANNLILNKSELAKLGAVFPTWKVRQITWPSVTEINSASVAVDEKLKASCIDWMQKFIKKEYSSEDLNKHLIAMKNWGLIRKKSQQKRLCDVFVVRFKKNSWVIHIQESPSNVVIGVSNDQLADKPRNDHKELVMEATTLFLNETLKSKVSSENLHVYETTENEQKVTRVLWAIESVLVTDEKGRKCIDSFKACEIGATHVEAETDGRFVKFDIFKTVKGPLLIPDPYLERFSASK